MIYKEEVPVMTLIYGYKSQDGIYLAADTRLTITSTEGVVSYHDDFGKYHTFNDNLHLVVAGDANFASFMIQELEQSDLKNSDFSEFRNKIESKIREIIGFYPLITSAKNVVFIFAGCTPSKNETVNMESVAKYTQFAQDDTTLPPLNIKPAFIRAAIDAAQNAKKGSILELVGTPYTGLFCMECNITDVGFDVKFVDAEWGEYIMRGPCGLTEKDAPISLASKIDGKKNSDWNYEDILRYNCLNLIEFFLVDIVPQKALLTVGGSIMTLLATSKGAIFPAGEVAQKLPDGTMRYLSAITVRNGLVSTKINGQIIPLQQVHDFFKLGKKSDSFAEI